MKLLKVFAISLLFPACMLLSSFSTYAPADDNDPGVDSFLNLFLEASLMHNQQRLMAMMDQEYKEKQHDKVYKGNTRKFLDQLFCGTIIGDNGGARCVKLNKLENIELASKGDGDKEVTVVFRVYEKKYKVDVMLMVRIRHEPGKRHYGIIGPIGK